jgi:hypothetical protein
MITKFIVIVMHDSYHKLIQHSNFEYSGKLSASETT